MQRVRKKKRNIKRSFLGFLGILICSILIFIPVSAQENDSSSGWGEYGTDPITILDTVVDKANEDFKVSETKLDTVNPKEWWQPIQYKITNTLEYFRKNINPYLQWIIFIGMAAAVILLIWNGFLMVTNATHNKWDIKKVKENITNILIGVVIMLGFVALIRIVTAVINYLVSF